MSEAEAPVARDRTGHRKFGALLQAAGFGSLAFAALLLLYGLLGIFVDRIHGAEVHRPISFTVAALLIAAGLILLRRGRRERAVLVEPKNLDDRYILLLRSFRVDLPRRPSRAKALLQTVGGSTDLSQLTSEEEALVSPISKVATVVTVGNPSDTLPQLGATRMYIDDGSWQEKVRGMIQCARLTIIMVDTTEGLGWELREVLATHSDPTKVILYLPSRFTSGPDAAWTWLKFRTLTESIFPKPLPSSLGETPFVCFKPDWSPLLLPPPPRSGLERLSTFGMNPFGFLHALNAALRHAGEQPSPIDTRRYKQFFAALWITAIALGTFFLWDFYANVINGKP